MFFKFLPLHQTGFLVEKAGMTIAKEKAKPWTQMAKGVVILVLTYKNQIPNFL
jgi:hypothetical protein